LPRPPWAGGAEIQIRQLGRKKFTKKREKFYRGAYIQFCSNLLYQKFLRKTSIARPPLGGGRAGNLKIARAGREEKGVWGK
jgi:hypothetical protein